MAGFGIQLAQLGYHVMQIIQRNAAEIFEGRIITLCHQGQMGD